MRKTITILFLMLLMPNFFCLSQTNWKSTKYNYSIEIPFSFSSASAVGSNVDFKATKGLSSIVIVVKTIPYEYSSFTIWDMLGDLETFGEEWQSGAKEYMANPKFLKYGKTSLSNLETFWFDYTTENPILYSKNYQTKKGNKLYTVTLTCPKSEYNYYSSIWFRFKDKMKIE
jgi:hypothetical protein